MLKKSLSVLDTEETVVGVKGRLRSDFYLAQIKTMIIKSPDWKPSLLRSCCQEYNPNCSMCNSMGQVSIKILQGVDYSATYINGKMASQEDHIYHLLKDILPVLNTLNLSNIDLTCIPASAFEFNSIWDDDSGYLPNWSDIEKHRL